MQSKLNRPKSKQKRKHALGIFKIVPDFVEKIPKLKLEVTYTKTKIENGTIITPFDSKDPPQIKWEADEERYYFLAMIDPDVPSNIQPIFREWQHWVIGNISGNEVKKGTTKDLGSTLTEYVGPCPPKGTDFHRYIFLLYEQPEKLQFEETLLENSSGRGRRNFSVKNLALKYNLRKPIAVNFFQAKWDPYVPLLYKQLTKS